ncbi:hypothetical protein B9Z55_018311 [Caenorhabditis nigoni]|uniref:Uncharacterized protein n=1 Tax=Caenorhabditis nigoni TaxID=1611254 RepID=A0A2G5TD99_9PELO|nr:hypothetical protein B9Z55_018311 [Caenorhabditis nigoni]
MGHIVRGCSVGTDAHRRGWIGDSTCRIGVRRVRLQRLAQREFCLLLGEWVVIDVRDGGNLVYYSKFAILVFTEF